MLHFRRINLVESLKFVLLIEFLADVSKVKWIQMKTQVTGMMSERNGSDRPTRTDLC